MSRLDQPAAAPVDREPRSALFDVGLFDCALERISHTRLTAGDSAAAVADALRRETWLHPDPDSIVPFSCRRITARGAAP